MSTHDKYSPPLRLDLACTRFVVQSLCMSQENPVHQRVILPENPSAAWAPLFQSLGLPLYQVKVEERTALIQAPPEDFARLLIPEVRTALLQHGKSLGYLFVTLDMNYEP